jgi:hypothetical protein
MPNTQRPASVFDDMLAKTRKKFDDLYPGGPARAGGEAAVAAERFEPQRSDVPSPAGASSLRLDPDSPAVRRLNERFGADWRYEITDEKRVGDEAIVLCKLVVGKDGAVRTQFGRAAVSPAPVVGTSGGVKFKLNVAGAGPNESNAFRRAAEAALMNCVELI